MTTIFVEFWEFFAIFEMCMYLFQDLPRNPVWETVV
jgi:hypothetical protein